MSPSDPPVAAPSEIQTEPCPRCGTICPAGWCGVCHAPILPPAAPPPHQHIDVEAMRSNLHATFGKGWDDSRDGRQAFHHGMDHVCNALAAWQRGESTNGILPDPWLSQGGWVALDRIDKLVQQLRADFGRERDRNQVLETELAALRTSRVAAPTPHLRTVNAIRKRLAKRREPQVGTCSACGHSQQMNPSWRPMASGMAIEQWRCPKCGGQIQVTFTTTTTVMADDDIQTLLDLLDRVAAPTPETPSHWQTLLAEELREHNWQSPDISYCWWCQCDVNGVNEPEEPHDVDCWGVRAATLLAGAVSHPQPEVKEQ